MDKDLIELRDKIVCILEKQEQRDKEPISLEGTHKKLDRIIELLEKKDECPDRDNSWVDDGTWPYGCTYTTANSGINCNGCPKQEQYEK